MNSNIDRHKPRPLEVRIRSVEGEDVSLASAERYDRSACDFLFVVQGFRDMLTGAGDPVEVDSLVHASYDAKTEKELDLEGLYNVWISLAGAIARHADASAEALRIRRFVTLVLERVQLDENLQRLVAEKALHPEKTEEEILKGMLQSSGA